MMKQGFHQLKQVFRTHCHAVYTALGNAVQSAAQSAVQSGAPMLAAWLLALSALGALSGVAQASSSTKPAPLACGPQAPTLLRLNAQLWWVAGAPGEPQPSNRGRTANQLLLRHAGRVWLLGSGVSPAAGRALVCVLRRQLGWRVTDVINPWSRPELVLGNQAFVQGPKPARLWAHADVAAAMQRQCPHCVERLHQRLGDAAADLGPAPILLPTHRLHGQAGQLGPWRWWRLERSGATQASQVVTVWHLAGQPWWWAPGLLWADGPPDLRDTHAPALAAALAQLEELVRAEHAERAERAERARRSVFPAAGKVGLPISPARWLPTQGPWLGAGAPQDQRAYLAALQAAVRASQEAGALETEPPAVLPGLPAYLSQGERAALNWQRVWRALEAQSFAPAESAAATAAAAAASAAAGGAP